MFSGDVFTSLTEKKRNKQMCTFFLFPLQDVKYMPSVVLYLESPQ